MYMILGVQFPAEYHDRTMWWHGSTETPGRLWELGAWWSCRLLGDGQQKFGTFPPLEIVWCYNHFNILFGLEPRPTSQGYAGRLKDEIQPAWQNLGCVRAFHNYRYGIHPKSDTTKHSCWEWYTQWYSMVSPSSPLIRSVKALIRTLFKGQRLTCNYHNILLSASFDHSVFTFWVFVKWSACGKILFVNTMQHTRLAASSVLLDT